MKELLSVLVYLVEKTHITTKYTTMNFTTMKICQGGGGRGEITQVAKDKVTYKR